MRLDEGVEFVRVPTILNERGERILLIFDEHGIQRAKPVAEVVLETLFGTRPSDHVVHFKDGDRSNLDPANLEWIPESETTDASARAKAGEVRRRLDAFRESLRGFPQTDSAELIAEDRAR